jgi:hypothetical protein
MTLTYFLIPNAIHFIATQLFLSILFLNVDGDSVDLLPHVPVGHTSPFGKRYLRYSAQTFLLNSLSSRGQGDMP